MQFIPSKLSDVYLIRPEPITDKRGFFARTYCENEFRDMGLSTNPVQCNTSYNRIRGTLRGLHFQRKPNSEAKLIRCTNGAIYDVVVDLRKGSSSFMEWASYELTAENRNALYVPEGFAHGFQALIDDTEVFYQMFNFFSPNDASGIKWNDLAFKIEWPLANPVISDKDQSYPDFDGFTL